MADTERGYGPNATEANVAECERLRGALEAELLHVLPHVPEDDVVYLGAERALLAVAGHLSTRRTLLAPSGDVLVVVSREDLARRLRALGRQDDAVKVWGGPPGDLPRRSARLVVAELGTLVGVSWMWAGGVDLVRASL